MPVPFPTARFGFWRFARPSARPDTTPPTALAVWTVSSTGSPGARIVNPDGYDPYNQGTFWGKWIARNPYHAAFRCRVREGFVGDATDAMRVRNYVIDRVEGPTNGQVTLVAKDLFSLIEARKAVAPVASNGNLVADITSVAASATLTPTGIGNLEYPAAGNVAIGDEMITFTRSGDVLTLTVRGALGTVAAAHKQEDAVQLVLSYVTKRAVDIVYDLLLNYTALTVADLPKADWDLKAAQLTALYTAYIAKPTPVNELVGELCEQVGFTLWPDLGSGQVLLSALRARVPDATVDDNVWIVADSFSVKRQDDRRASQVWVYYAQINPTLDIGERKNFHSRALTVDLAAEGNDQYGTAAIREIFSRWIPQFGRSLALDTGERVIAMFRDPPLEARFRVVAARDGALALASYFNLATADVQDDTGAILQVPMATVEIERGENEIGIRAQQVAFAAPSASGERVIYIENDVANVDMRVVHDSLFAAPVGGETVRFVVVDGFTVGGTSTASPAMQTGSWPAGVTLKLDIHGRIQGKGGRGGAGATLGAAGSAGLIGGDALKATYALSVDNTDGKLWAGGGGGGGGGAFSASGGDPRLPFSGGGGGGGAAGSDPGSGGGGGVSFQQVNGNIGATGTKDAGGAGGAGAPNAGTGGTGGGPGLTGNAGGSATTAGGAGGTFGKYINGNAFVTWIATGDRRGGVA